jgi:uncharacterized protein with PIN domain
MHELITRCDYCDVPIEFGRQWEIDIRNPSTHQADRWTLCKNCCRNHTLLELANTIDQKTAQAEQ